MKISTILDNIDNGAIALPEFQRGYVWQRNQVRGLMDSLYRGHPVGSLLTWLTRTEIADARGDGQLQPGTVQLLLDGQQRVTTLYGLVRGRPPRFFDGNERAFQDLRFHLDDETFEFWQPVKMRDDELWIDVATIFQDGAFSVISSLFERYNDDPRAKDWMERVNRIEQIPNREFHIEQVTGDDKTVDVVVDIFNRVNSGGTKLSKGDLALAKICAEWPEARDEMKSRLARWRTAGFEFRLELLLRVMNALITGRAPFSALANATPQQVKDGLERAEKAIDRALNAISSRLGLDHGSVLPNPFAIVILAKYLADHDMSFSDHATRDKLMYWYVHVSMWGRYAGSTETVLAKDLEALASSDRDPIDALIANVRQQRGSLEVRADDFRAWSKGARFYPILYMLTRTGGARDWGTGDKLDRHALGRYSDLEIHHIFPKKVLYDAGRSRAEANAIANFTFLSKETNLKISAKRPADYLPEYVAAQPGAVESHWMPTNPELWELDRYDDFLEARREALATATNELLERLLSGAAVEADEVVGVMGELGTPTAETEGELPDEEPDPEEALLAELREWLAERGLPTGERNHELTDEAGSVVAILDLAWPDGLQTELSEPVAVLIDEPDTVFAAAAQASYRVFSDIDGFKQYAESLIGLAAPQRELVG